MNGGKMIFFRGLLCMSCAAVLGAGSAAAESGADGTGGGIDWPIFENVRPYIGLAGGWNHVNDIDTNTEEIGVGSGVEGRGFVGVVIEDDFRLEGEVGYGQVDGVETTDIKSLRFHINALYDLPTGFFIRPYVGVGAGMTHVTFDNVTTTYIAELTDSDLVFSYQAMAGFNVDLSDSFTIFTGYRYVDTTEASFTVDRGTAQVPTGSTLTTDDMDSHILELGIRYVF